ncbi:hypothetical protein ACNQFZ_01910 [Schinkia sp. CFF1]
MKSLFWIIFLSILLTGCSVGSSSKAINTELMDDNAQIINIANRTSFSDLNDDDKAFIDEFLSKYYNDKKKFESYNEKEQKIVLEAVEKIKKMKDK